MDFFKFTIKSHSVKFYAIANILCLVFVILVHLAVLSAVKSRDAESLALTVRNYLLSGNDTEAHKLLALRIGEKNTFLSIEVINLHNKSYFVHDEYLDVQEEIQKYLWSLYAFTSVIIRYEDDGEIFATLRFYYNIWNNVAYLVSAYLLLSLVCFVFIKTKMKKNRMNVFDRTSLKNNRAQEKRTMDLNYEKIDSFTSQSSIEERFKVLSENTKMLAHDVRRPLFMIEALIEMMQNTDNASRLNELASRGSIDVKRAISSVNAAIKAALAEDDLNTLVKSEVSPYDLILEVLKDVFSYRDCQIQNFEYDFHHDALLLIDKEKIKRVLTNIVINAVEASPVSQIIWFESSIVESMIQLSIGNSGSYVASDKLEKIFDSKFTEGKSDGNGVGLSIAKKFVEAHGGSLVCRSDERGVEFLIYLPIEESSHGKEKVISLPETSLDLSRFSEINRQRRVYDDEELSTLKVLNRYRGQKLKIVICDDDSLYINGLVNNFKKYSHLTKNLEIVSYANPVNLLNEKADVYILDYDYGVGSSLDGLQAAKKLRKHGHKGVICIHSNVLQLVGPSALPDDVDMGYQKPMSQSHCLDILIEGFEKQMDDRNFFFKLENSEPDIDSDPVELLQVRDSCFLGKVAVIDDDPVSCILDLDLLREHGCHVVEFRAIDLFLDAIEDNTLNIDEFECIITDRNIGRMDVSMISFPSYMTDQHRFLKPILMASYSFVEVEKEPFSGFKYGVPKENLQSIIMSNLEK